MEFLHDENLNGPTKIEKRRKDKSDISTVDKVLDPKTIDILNKLSKRGKLVDLCGAFSSGKEANIYTGKCTTSLISKFIQRDVEHKEEVIPVVLKIYKTSTMLFKDRTRYIIDEKRFKKFCTSNSRKLIKLWSEKEVRNLKRLGKHNIPCPKPLYLKRNILIMSMIGNNEPAPRLRDANIKNMEEWKDAYDKCIQLIKDMYQKARLIHADFSEYNLIYHNKEIYVIDVSQSMDIHQENSNTFLVMDIFNCNEFFSKKGVEVHEEVDLFEEITNLKVPDYLKIDGKLNKDSFIPSRIIEVANKEDIKLFISDYKDSGLGNATIQEDGIGTDYYEDEEFISDDVEDDIGTDYFEDEEFISDDIEDDIGTDYYTEESFCNDEEENRNNLVKIVDEINLDENKKITDLELNELSNARDEEEELSSVDIEDNEVSNIGDEEDKNDQLSIKNKEARFNLKTFAELSLEKINIYVRRLRLKNPNITKEEEKAFNKQRKQIVKQMNKERRIKRVQKKEVFNNKKKYRNKKKTQRKL